MKHGKKHGYGVENYSGEQEYVGEYKDGKKHGQGAFTFPSGSKYVGGWKNGKRNGQGTLTSSDGNKYVGEWKQDNPWEGMRYDKAGKVVASYSQGVEKLIN